MLRETTIESVTNAGMSWSIASAYSGISNLWGSHLDENPYLAREQVHHSFRHAKAAQAITRFLQSIESQAEFQGVASRALGVFDGQLYLWLFTRELSTELTRSLFALKYAIEQQLDGEFEIHVEPLGGRRVDDLIPSGYATI